MLSYPAILQVVHSCGRASTSLAKMFIGVVLVQPKVVHSALARFVVGMLIILVIFDVSGVYVGVKKRSLGEQSERCIDIATPGLLVGCTTIDGRIPAQSS